MSLRRNLFLLISFSTLAVWLAVSWFVHERLMHEADEIYDAQLAQYAHLLMGVVKANADPDNLDELQRAIPASPFTGFPRIHSLVDDFLHAPGHYQRVIGFQLVDSAGKVLLHSEGAPETPLTENAGGGFSTSTVESTSWRVFSYTDPEYPLTLHAGEQHDIRREVSRYIIESMLAPVVLGFPVVGLLIWLSVSRGLRPLVTLAGDVKSRDPGSLSPVDSSAAPSEISPLINSLNGLLKRLQQALESERRFTGDAAHELRTPLAALRVQTQVALKSTDETQRQSALRKVLSGVDRMGHLVNQLLLLCRLDWQQDEIGKDEVSLVTVAQEVKDDLDTLARDKQAKVDIRGSKSLSIRGNPLLINALIRNLVDNAIRYGRNGGHVDLEVLSADRQIVLRVADDGPGIASEELEMVFNRFHRRPGSGSTGSGLGLSIVSRICDLHGAGIDLSHQAGKGLQVEVRFPCQRLLEISRQSTHRPPPS